MLVRQRLQRSCSPAPNKMNALVVPVHYDLDSPWTRHGRVLGYRESEPSRERGGASLHHESNIVFVYENRYKLYLISICKCKGTGFERDRGVEEEWRSGGTAHLLMTAGRSTPTTSVILGSWKLHRGGAMVGRRAEQRSLSSRSVRRFTRPGSVARSLGMGRWCSLAAAAAAHAAAAVLAVIVSELPSVAARLDAVSYMAVEAESWKATGELAEMQNTYVALPLRWRQLKEQYDYNPLEIVVLNTEIPIECLLLFWLFTLLTPVRYKCHIHKTLYRFDWRGRTREASRMPSGYIYPTKIMLNDGGVLYNFSLSYLWQWFSDWCNW